MRRPSFIATGRGIGKKFSQDYSERSSRHVAAADLLLYLIGAMCLFLCLMASGTRAASAAAGAGMLAPLFVTNPDCNDCRNGNGKKAKHDDGWCVHVCVLLVWG